MNDSMDLQDEKQPETDTNLSEDDLLHLYWDYYLDGISLVMRAYETAQRNAVYRTKQPFPLTPFDIIKLLIRSRGRCEVSGMPFSGEVIPGCKNRPYVPSIDRIRPKEPYSLDNCRLVCWAVNLAMCDWGDAVFWRIVRCARDQL